MTGRLQRKLFIMGMSPVQVVIIFLHAIFRYGLYIRLYVLIKRFVVSRADRIDNIVVLVQTKLGLSHGNCLNYSCNHNLKCRSQRYRESLNRRCMPQMFEPLTRGNCMAKYLYTLVQ